MRDEHSFKAVVKIVTFLQKSSSNGQNMETAVCFFVLRAAVLLVSAYLSTVYEMPIVREYVFYDFFSKSKKRDFLRFLKCHVKKT